MKLIRLQLKNFGPYRGIQTMDLDVSGQAPVVLVHGENMRGKTTILRGLRWALYGEVRAHDGTLIPDADFANYEVRDLGADFEFGVTVVYEDRGSVNELTRMCDARVDSDLIESSVEVIRTAITLKPVDGNPIPERDIPEAIARTLHANIADFFLFDGEMLSRFEESLRSDSTRSQVVKRSIERVLGLPALQLLKTDATALLHDADAVIRKAAGRQREAAKLEAQYAEKDSELRRLVADTTQLAEHRTRVDQEVLTLGEELARVDAVKEMYYKRKRLEEEISEAQADLADLEADLKARTTECWWMPLAGAIAQRVAKADADLEAAIRDNQTRGALIGELHQLQTRTSLDVCPTCHQPMSAHVVEAVNQREAEIGSKLAAMPESGADLGDLHARRKQFLRYASAQGAVERIAEIEGDMNRLRIRIADKQEEISELSDALRDTRLDIAAVEANFQEQKDLLREIDRATEQAEEDRAKLNQELRQINQAIAKYADGGTPERHERDLLDALVDSVESAIGAFRERMRGEVEDEASKIFKQLSTEETYAGLRIDGRYYLEIVDDLDRVIRRRSAGADQIVTMSLIGALVRCAVRQGPVVMDTPFGRLDRGHRERILRWVPTLGTQVVMFVQSGEFDRDRDLAHLNGMIGREFVLRRVTATRTEIEAIEHG